MDAMPTSSTPRAGRNRSGPQPSPRPPPASRALVSELQASFVPRPSQPTAPSQRDAQIRTPPRVAPKPARSPGGSAGRISELQAILAQKERPTAFAASAPPPPPPAYWQLPAAEAPAFPVPAAPARMTAPAPAWPTPAGGSFTCNTHGDTFHTPATSPAIMSAPTAPAIVSAPTVPLVPMVAAPAPAGPAIPSFPAIHPHPHTNRGRQRRLELYNDIQDQLKQLGTSGLCQQLVADLKAALPEVVVVGQQSAGKSTVFNDIAGVGALFPTGTQTTTRTPIRLQLHDDVAAGAEPYALVYVGGTRPGNRTRVPVVGNSVPNAIRDCTDTLVANRPGGFCDTEVVVELHKHGVPLLTLIDLPGLVQGHADDEVIAAVQDMVRRYSQGKNAVVVVVSEAGTEKMNEPSYKFIGDSEGSGCWINVHTKLDCLHSKIRSARDPTAIEAMQVKCHMIFRDHGIRQNFGVVADPVARARLPDGGAGLARAWTSASVTAGADTDSEGNPPFSFRFGTAALGHHLEDLLDTKFKASLPRLRDAMGRAEKTLRSELQDAPTYLSTQSHVLHILQKFGAAYSDVIGGTRAQAPDGVPAVDEIRTALDGSIDAHMDQLIEVFGSMSLKQVEQKFIEAARDGEGKGYDAGHLPLTNWIQRELTSTRGNRSGRVADGLLDVHAAQMAKRDEVYTPHILRSLRVDEPTPYTELDVNDYPNLHADISAHAKAMFAGNDRGSVMHQAASELKGSIKCELLYFNKHDVSVTASKDQARLAEKFTRLQRWHEQQHASHPERYDEVFGPGFRTATLAGLCAAGQSADPAATDQLEEVLDEMTQQSIRAFGLISGLDTLATQARGSDSDEGRAAASEAPVYFETGAQHWHRLASDTFVHLRLCIAGPALGTLTLHRSKKAPVDDCLTTVNVKDLGCCDRYMDAGRYFATFNGFHKPNGAACSPKRFLWHHPDEREDLLTAIEATRKAYAFRGQAADRRARAQQQPAEEEDADAAAEESARAAATAAKERAILDEADVVQRRFHDLLDGCPSARDEQDKERAFREHCAGRQTAAQITRRLSDVREQQQAFRSIMWYLRGLAEGARPQVRHVRPLRSDQRRHRDVSPHLPAAGGRRGHARAARASGPGPCPAPGRGAGRPCGAGAG